MEKKNPPASPEERNPDLYRYRSPVRPRIRKLGTICCDMVETTPVVFGGELYRFEYVRPGEVNEANKNGRSYFHFVCVRTSTPTAPFAEGYHMGSAFADGDDMYVAGIPETWGNNEVHIFRSKDLANWTLVSRILLPKGLGAFNTGICKKAGKYVLLVEVNKPVSFTFRFAVSKNMSDWEFLPETCRLHKDGRYAGGPAIYTLPDDPYYYVFYLEAYPECRYATSVARSKDLSEWTYSPINPVLMYSEEDKLIANPFLSLHEQERIKRALDINNSDLEICEFNGRTILYYSWGNQHGIEFLAEAAFEGTVKEFLQSFFDT